MQILENSYLLRLIFRTPLQWTLMTGKEDVVQALIEAGADVNFGNPPPITIAAQMGRLNSVKLMIEHNVNVNAEILYEYFMITALNLAENYNREDIVALLRDAGARKGEKAILSH